MNDKQTERYVTAFESIAASLAILARSGQIPSNVVNLKEEPRKEEKPAKEEKPKKEEKPAKEEKPKDDKDEVTLTMLTTLARKLVRSEKKPLIIELLDNRGISKISATPKEDWTEVFEALTAIDENE